MARVLRDGAFEGETHMVTGAAQGIGHAVATAGVAVGIRDRSVDIGGIIENKQIPLVESQTRFHGSGCRALCQKLLIAITPERPQPADECQFRLRREGLACLHPGIT